MVVLKLDEAIERLRANDSSLTNLELYVCHKFGDEGAIALANALVDNATLTGLILGGS